MTKFADFDYITEAKRVHVANIKWWQDLDGLPIYRNRGEMCMLMVSEIAEAMEAVRKNAMDDKLPHRKGEEVELADLLIRMLDYFVGCNLPVVGGKEASPIAPDANIGELLLSLVRDCVHICELSYGIHRDDESYYVTTTLEKIFVYAEFRNLDLLGAYEEKMAYNVTRVDHSLEHRRQDGGKKW